MRQLDHPKVDGKILSEIADLKSFQCQVPEVDRHRTHGPCAGTRHSDKWVRNRWAKNYTKQWQGQYPDVRCAEDLRQGSG